MWVRDRYRHLSYEYAKTMHNYSYRDLCDYMIGELKKTGATQVRAKQHPADYWMVASWVDKNIEKESYIEVEGEYFFDNPNDAVRFKLVWG
jgi:hypothetical protein